MSINSEEDLIRANMLIHGYSTDVELLKIEEKLVDLAVSLVVDDSYEKTGFEAKILDSHLLLKSSRIFLREKLILHEIPCGNEELIKEKLNGKIVRNEKEVVQFYNEVGIMKDPFSLPVRFVNQPYYYGNVLLTTNLSDSEEFLRNMKILFKEIELGRKTTEMTSVCYVHEIIHTQLSSMKGVVKEYFNSELLSIFMEMLYAYENNILLFKETLKNRINLLLFDFDSLFKYVVEGKTEVEDPKWHNLAASKYIVSTLKAFNLLNKYINADKKKKEEMLWDIQEVISGITTLEDFLINYDISYENSLEKEHVLKLINK